MRIGVKIGDVYSFKLPNGQFGYARYLFNHPKMSKLVEIKAVIDDGSASLADVLAAPRLFPPVFVGLNVAVRLGFWRKIGSSAVCDFQFPRFRRSLRGLMRFPEEGSYDDWEIWDGSAYSRIGKLSKEYEGLEFIAVWSSDLLEDRVATGANHFDRMR